MITSHCGETSRSRSSVPSGPIPVQYPISSCPFFDPSDGTGAADDAGAASLIISIPICPDAGQGTAAARSIRVSGKLYGPIPPVYQPIRATLARCHVLPPACITQLGPDGRSLRSLVSSGLWSVYRVAGLFPPHPWWCAPSIDGHI